MKIQATEPDGMTTTVRRLTMQENTFLSRAEGAIEHASWDGASVALALLALTQEVRALGEVLQRLVDERAQRAAQDAAPPESPAPRH